MEFRWTRCFLVILFANEMLCTMNWFPDECDSSSSEICESSSSSSDCEEEAPNCFVDQPRPRYKKPQRIPCVPCPPVKKSHPRPRNPCNYDRCPPPQCKPANPWPPCVIVERPKQEVCDVKVRNVKQRVCRSGRRRECDIDFNHLRRVFDQHILYSDGFIHRKLEELANELVQLPEAANIKIAGLIKEELHELERIIFKIIHKAFEVIKIEGDKLFLLTGEDLLRAVLQFEDFVGSEAIGYSRGIINLGNAKAVFLALTDPITGLIPSTVGFFNQLEAGLPQIVSDERRKVIALLNALLRHEKEITEHAIRKAFDKFEHKIINQIMAILGVQKQEIKNLVLANKENIIHELHRILDAIRREIIEILKHTRNDEGGKRCKTKRFQLKEVNCGPE